MDVTRYLARLGYAGPATPSGRCLSALMRAHVAAVPFENIDQQLGVRTPLDLAAAYDKIVERRRGGWCFELNRLFAWVLREIGFEVDLLSARVGAGLAGLDDHATLRVACGRPLLVDVGFGGGLAAPIALAPGRVVHPPYAIELTRQAACRFAYSETAHGETLGFSFSSIAADDNAFARANDLLQTDEASIFKRLLIVHRRRGDTRVLLRNATLIRIAPAGVSKQNLTSLEAFAGCLRTEFGLEPPDVEALWRRASAREAPARTRLK